ncbi:MAG: helix-turn-helix domain-containing protein [Oscillospiraceae bacterium]|nr:helix-turn-helix domain-containing protein [Oscillospiraceae bacterium]
MKSNLAEALSRLRRETRQSQRQAAEQLGVSQALLSHYETGLREPKLEFIIKACDYYGVTADYLLGRTHDPRRAEDLSRVLDAAVSICTALGEVFEQNISVPELIARLRGD